MAREAAVNVLLEECGNLIDAMAEFMGLQTDPPLSKRAEYFDEIDPDDLKTIDDLDRWKIVRASKYKAERKVDWQTAISMAYDDLKKAVGKKAFVWE